MEKFKFIDLFAGIGGFHQAMTSLGGECVFAADIDDDAVKVYKENYNMDDKCDLTKVDPKDIPPHDVLCGGFPCQAFSNAGKKKGFNDVRGTLFFDVKRIIEYHKPKFIFLENVKHLVKHDNGNTWRVIKQTLLDLGYILPKNEIIASPHEIGIPQYRPRIYIMGIREDLTNKEFLNIKKPEGNIQTSIYDILDKEVDKKYNISEYENLVLTAWNEFKVGINKDVYGFPVWVEEFGQTYDYSNLPKWKQEYIKKNRDLYLSNKQFIDQWIEKYNVKSFKLRDKKFEWQAGIGYKTVWDTSIQLRQSGIRCKKIDYFPALVAMVQTPIIGKYKRRITPREAARLQSFPENFIIDKNDQHAYKQFGNSLNIELVKFFAKQLFNQQGGDNES